MIIFFFQFWFIELVKKYRTLTIQKVLKTVNELRWLPDGLPNTPSPIAQFMVEVSLLARSEETFTTTIRRSFYRFDGLIYTSKKVYWTITKP